MGGKKVVEDAKTARSRCRWSVSGDRACGTVCECHELVDGASERLVGARDRSAARVSAAVAARIVVQPVVWPQANGHAQLAAVVIEAGLAAGEGVLGLARASRPRQRVAARRALHKQHALVGLVHLVAVPMGWCGWASDLGGVKQSSACV